MSNSSLVPSDIPRTSVAHMFFAEGKPYLSWCGTEVVSLNISEIFHQLQSSRHTPTILSSVWNNSLCDGFLSDLHRIELSF